MSEHAEEQVTKALADIAELRTQLAARDRQIEHLTKMLFARQSERLADGKHPKLPLVWDEPSPTPPPHVEEAADEEYEEITYTRKKRGATRISKDLPREVHTIALSEADRKCPCCNEPMHKIGEECSERLDYTPAVLKVIETRREKYACKKHEESGVLTPPVPIHPIEKGQQLRRILHPIAQRRLRSVSIRNCETNMTKDIDASLPQALDGIASLGNLNHWGGWIASLESEIAARNEDRKSLSDATCYVAWLLLSPEHLTYRLRWHFYADGPFGEGVVFTKPPPPFCSVAMR